MQIQSVQIPELKLSSLLSCSKPQLRELLHSPCPQQQWVKLRAAVPFYKESTLRCVAKAVGLLGMSAAMIFWLFWLETGTQFSGYILPGVCLCFAFSALFWICLNGGALAALWDTMGQRKRLWIPFCLHVLYGLLFTGTALFLSSGPYLTGAFAASLGMDFLTASIAVHNAIIAGKIVVLAALFVSLVCSIRVSISYFTVSCHSLLLLLMLFLLSAALQDMSSTAQMFANRMYLGILLYFGMLAVFAGAFLFYTKRFSKIKHQNDSEMQKC